MKLGIMLSKKRFWEEANALRHLLDFVEVFIVGDDDVSSLLGCGFDLVGHLPELDGKCFESLDQLRQLGARKAVVHFHTRGQMTFEEKTHILGGLQHGAAENGIVLCLENTEETIDVLKSVFMEVPELRFCLDIGHANLSSNDPLAFLDAFNERLDHIHVSDNKGGDTERDDLHLPPGEGTIDFQRIFNGLKRQGYGKTVTLEIHPRFDLNVKTQSLLWLRNKLKC